MLEQKLSDPGERGSSKNHHDVPQRGRTLSRIEDVGG
jgi:hypothetical protein